LPISWNFRPFFALIPAFLRLKQASFVIILDNLLKREYYFNLLEQIPAEIAFTCLKTTGAIMTKRNGTHTILIIEDEPDIRNFIGRVLELDGYNVLKAGDGSAGLAILEEYSIDMILLDLRLPGLNGWAVLREIKSTPRLSKLPVVVITAHADPSYRQRVLSMGAAQYLTKPLSVEQLSKTIAKILAKKATRHSIKKELSFSHA
jgi:CheY-like chemotaxis protein